MAFLGELLINVADRGRALIGFERFLGKGARSIDRLCEDLLSGRGEASGMALAQAVLEAWQRLDKPGRLAASVAEHRLIAEAIAAGDAELAAHATHIHLHNALIGILDSVGDASFSLDRTTLEEQGAA